MIKRTNKIIALIMSITTITTLGSSITAFAADMLEEKEGDFSSAFAYSNKYLYDGYRGTDGDEQTIYYKNGKYYELEDVEAYDDSVKYDSKYIELDDDGNKNLFNLDTGKFEDESIQDQENNIKRNLIKDLKQTERYGSDVGEYLNLDKRIATNKGAFGDVWYQYSANYNGQDMKYVTIIDVDAKSTDEWDNITLKKGNGIESNFGDSYQFWFSVTTNDTSNKESDGQAKTYNGNVAAAAEYIAGRIKNYCGHNAEVIQENGKYVIQIISDTQLDGNVIQAHNSDISVTTRTVPAKNIEYIAGNGEDAGSLGNSVEADNNISLTIPPVDSITTSGAVQYSTTIDINDQTEHQWRNITLKKGEGITSSFGDSYQFWFSITENDPSNLESDGQAKTYNGDVNEASQYIAGRIRDYCGYDAQVVEKNGKPVIQVTSDAQLDGDVIISYDDNISVTTEEVTPTADDSTDTTTGSESSESNSDSDTGEDTGNTTGSTSNTHAIVNYDQLPIYYGVVNNYKKYMDISEFANIKLAYTVNDKVKTVNIEKFGEKYGNENIVASLKKLDVIAQDSNYIYADINVDFTSDMDINIEYPDSEKSKNYILKISKAIEDKTDEANMPKEVTAYEMNGESDYKSWTQAKLNDDWYNIETYSKNGNLYIVRFNKDKKNNKIQVNQVGFQTKVDEDLKINRNKIYKVNDPSIETGLKGEIITSVDSDEIKNLLKPYYSIDSEGNLWVLGKRKIYEFSGNGFDEKYTIPSQINNLDVYNNNNLVAWGDSESEEGYVTNINEYAKTDETTSEDSVISGNDDSNKDISNNEVQINNGWVKTKYGWQYFDESGKQIKNSWIKVDEKWYLINKDGIMQTGWVNISDKWYYQNSDGSMATGWVKLEDDLYYLHPDGSMATGWANIDGSWYYLRGSGKLAIGWILDSGNWYHLKTDGEMTTGWLKYNKKWYYFDKDGKMLTNTTINGYNIGNDGVLIN